MTLSERGRIHGGSILLSKPVNLPDGTEVSVSIQPVDHPESAVSGAVPLQAFFGIWAHRQDLEDSAEWVGRERSQWQNRTTRQD